MDEADVKAIPELEQLQILEQDHSAARFLIAGTYANTIAEATDTVRLFELLHRDEYQPMAAVRFREPEPVSIRVYFRLLNRDE
jgi:hypothetical protein